MKQNELLTEFINCLDMEIETKNQKAVYKPIILKNGIREYDSVYKFNIGCTFPPDTPAEIKICLEIPVTYAATLISTEKEVLLINISDIEEIDSIVYAELIVRETKLLEAVKESIENLASEKAIDHEIANKVFGITNITSNKKFFANSKGSLNASQVSAVELSLGSDVTYMWGPPGTGKSATLGTIAEQLLKINKTILIAAHTNEAVDGLMEKVVKVFSQEDISKGEIIRWRYTQSEKLNNITPSNILSKRTVNQRKSLKTLKQEKELHELELLNLNRIVYLYDELIKIESDKGKLKMAYDKGVLELDKKNKKLKNVVQNISKIKDWMGMYQHQFFFIKLINKKNFQIKFAECSELENIKKQLEDSINKIEVDNTEIYLQYIQLGQDFDEKQEEYYDKIKDNQPINRIREKLKMLKAKVNVEIKEINKLVSEIKKIESIDAEIELLKNARVVGITLTSATINEEVKKLEFDAVIVDEVSMAPCPNLYATCCLSKGKAILCGDFYQLSPIAECTGAEWLSKSIFDQRGITEKISNGDTLDELAILDTQYRTHPSVANSILHTVYKGMLKNGLQKDNPIFYSQNLNPFPNHSCILLDVSNTSNKEPWCIRNLNGGWINKKSAKIAIELTKQALESGIKSVGIITPYKNQAKYIKNELNELEKLYPNQKIEAATVHKYQGREMDMIIFDLIDSPGKYDLAPFLKGVHGTESMRLINVATTRARGKFIVIANVAFIKQKLYSKKDAILYQWLEYLKTQTVVKIKEDGTFN